MLSVFLEISRCLLYFDITEVKDNDSTRNTDFLLELTFKLQVMRYFVSSDIPAIEIYLFFPQH